MVLAALVWSLLVELFGRRWLVLLPYGIFCLTPLTLPAFTWLSAAIIWLPLMIAIAGAPALAHPLRRHGRSRDAAFAVVWLVVGLASFEKIVIFLPYLVFFTVAITPGARRGLRCSGRSSGAPLRCGSATSPPSPSTSCSTSPGCAAPATTPP